MSKEEMTNSEQKQTQEQPKTRKKFSEMESRFLTDYYKTNREITSSDRKRWKEEKAARKETGEKQPWTTSEKVMVAICILAAIGIVIRYGVLGDAFPSILGFFGIGAE